jgi:hypothetical protein
MVTSPLPAIPPANATCTPTNIGRSSLSRNPARRDVTR